MPAIALTPDGLDQDRGRGIRLDLPSQTHDVDVHGAGLDLAALRSLADARGVPWSPGREQEIIFADGLSTHAEVDEMAGRGVGMSAVRADLRAAGYAISVSTQQAPGTTFVIEPLHADGHQAHSEVA